MARPKKEGMDYFPHDTDAVNDEKIEALRMIYGNDGYAFYFILLERIYRSKDFELDVSDAETIQILAKKVDVTVEKFNSMLETSIKRGCFDKEIYENRKILTSEGIKKRAAVVVKKRATMREKYKEEVSDIVSDAETLQKVHKGKERKDKSKVIKTSSQKFLISDVENAKLLLGLMLDNNPDVRQPNDLDKWADEFRLMRERDKRTDEQIKFLINWTQNDSFWKTNILSPSKLRKQWDQLVLRAKEQHEKKKVSIGTHKKQNAVDFTKLAEGLGDE